MNILIYNNLLNCLQKQALSQPDKVVYRFLDDEDRETDSLTYQQLDQRARTIASQLQQIISPNSRALLVYPYNQGLDFITAFFGCLYAQVIAVPCHPPLSRLTSKEVEERLLEADTKLVLTHSNLLPKLQDKLSKSTNSNITWLSTDKIEHQEILKDISIDSISGDTIAFLQYTSGSTGKPKGVIVTHGAILSNQEMLQSAFGHNQNSIGVGWLPLFHDMGLIGNVIQAIYVGGSCVLFSPISFAQKPWRWLQAISRYRAVTSGAPNFAYDLLCDNVKDDEQLAKLDLSCWEVAFSGAEPIQKDTIERFSRIFSPCGFKSDAFFPCYGMAEATLFITSGRKTEAPVIKYVDKASLENNEVKIYENYQKGCQTLISCGRTWFDTKIVIANPQSLTQCKPNQVGEIWVSSSSLGQGYWQQPELTTQTFQASLKDSDNNQETFLRTGDLGFLQEGELFVTGRLKDVMIFWGLNHYPQQVEQTVEQCHSTLQPSGCAAFAVEVDGKDRLVIVAEVKRSSRNSVVIDDVVSAIRFALFQEHFLSVYAIVIIKPFSLPKTSSGKVQRSVCKAKFLDNSLDIVAQWYLPDLQSDNMTSLIQRYSNPLTYIEILGAIVRGRLKRWLYLLTPEKGENIQNI